MPPDLRAPITSEPCLVQSRAPRYRGGTLIATDIHDLREHEHRLHHADAYRPPSCPRCGHPRLHVHDRRHRTLLAEPRALVVTVVRHICASSTCRATWRILPAFIARHLWRRWPTVARTLAGDPHHSVAAPRVPDRTRRRWNARLRSAARQLVHLLMSHDSTDVARIAAIAGFDATRRALIDLFTATRVLGAHPLEDLAGTIHSLERGIRLM